MFSDATESEPEEYYGAVGVMVDKYLFEPVAL